jgi:hypothetical protein
VATPYDGRQYGGVSFFAALGGDAAGPLLTPVGLTTVDVAWNGGVCSVCMDFYGKSVELSNRWQRVALRFSELAQAGTGDPLGPLTPEELVGLIVWPKTPDLEDIAFDIWIDDVRFDP